ncbi:fibronectin type III domain-containing protein [Bacillus vallismortis]|uniref:fibronectin type III domain-containing protein n=1 Tax=Bacillus vallismortis TaxID=72361 RepID=UPI0022803BF1|nr:fibronectin type III domain-containing protein [Bacillus vallismortis]MCY8546418.1 fibronectin type III domain-containing protein [Bacillus vallismortis]
MKKFLFCFLFGLFIAAVYHQSAYAAEPEYYRVIDKSKPGSELSLNVNYKVGDTITVDFKQNLDWYSLRLNGVDFKGYKQISTRQVLTFQITQEMYDNNPNHIVLTTRGGDTGSRVTVYSVSLGDKLLYPFVQGFNGGLIDGSNDVYYETKAGSHSSPTSKVTDDDFNTFIKFDPDNYPYIKQLRLSHLGSKNSPANVNYFRIYTDSIASSLKIEVYDPVAEVNKSWTVTPEYYKGKPFEIEGFPSYSSHVQIKGFQKDDKAYAINFYDTVPGQFKNISDVEYIASDDSVKFSYTLPENFSYLKVWVNDQLKKDMVEDSSFELNQLIYDSSYNVKIISYSKDGGISSSYRTVVKTKPLQPPSDITNVKYKFDYKSLHMTYDLPKDDNFSHLEVYKNNVQIRSKLTEPELNFDDLQPSTDYTYKVVSVSNRGIRSEGYILSFKTEEYKDEVPPEKPTGLKVTNGNESLVLTWDKNSEFDLEGYHVYLDGKKITDKPIKSNMYTLPELENGKTYQVEVSAIDMSGNESEKTSKYGSPNTKGMPVFKAGYSLVDVSNGVGSWFSSLWLLLAFSVSIPLAFYISHRVKALFFA